MPTARRLPAVAVPTRASLVARFICPDNAALNGRRASDASPRSAEVRSHGPHCVASKLSHGPCRGCAVGIEGRASGCAVLGASPTLDGDHIEVVVSCQYGPVGGSVVAV